MKKEAILKESDIAAYLTRRVLEEGGMYRKVSWEGRSDAPDYLIMLNGVCVFVETKAPGRKPRLSQMREFAALEAHGTGAVLVVSTPDEVNMLMDGLTRKIKRDVVIDALTYERFSKEEL